MKITLSDDAKSALANTNPNSGTSTTTNATTSSTTADPSATALQTLSAKAPVSSADVGLAVLQDGAQAKAAADASNSTSHGNAGSISSAGPVDTNNPNKPYEVGDRLSVTA